MRLRLVKLLAVSATSLAAFAACGDDDGDAGPTIEEALGGGGDEADAPADGGEAAGAALAGDAERGLELVNENGCASCHGTGLGPDWEGLYGSEVELADGRTVVADEEYLALSISDPGADIVPGYDVAMQEYPHLTDDDIAAIVAYIATLADAAPPADGG